LASSAKCTFTTHAELSTQNINGLRNFFKVTCFTRVMFEIGTHRNGVSCRRSGCGSVVRKHCKLCLSRFNTVALDFHAV
jgi:hypothetical protein